MERGEHRVSINLRMPDDLHDEMHEVAKSEYRSLTAQINLALREWLDGYGREQRRTRERKQPEQS